MTRAELDAILQEFDDMFEDQYVEGSNGYIDIHREEIDEMKSGIKGFISAKFGKNLT